MRFSCDIHFNKNNIEIPSTYRSNLLSLIKESFKLSSPNDDFFSFNYNQPVRKLFTFSVYMRVEKKFGKLVLKENFVKFFFSTSDYEFLFRCYNGLLKLSAIKNNFVLFGEGDFTIKNFFFYSP